MMMMVTMPVAFILTFLIFLGVAAMKTEQSRSIEEDNTYFKRLFYIVPKEGSNNAEVIQGNGIPSKRKSKPTNSSSNKKIRKLPKQNEELRLRKAKLANSIDQKTGKTSSARVNNCTEKLVHKMSLDDKLKTRINELKAKRGQIDRNSVFERRLKKKEKKKKKKKTTKTQVQVNETKGSCQTVKKKENSEKSSKLLFNNKGNMAFSKFDFADSGEKKRSTNKLGGKNFKQLLQKVEKRERKIDEMKGKDESKAKKLQDLTKWQAALGRAQGEKVKDNPELLKKALKRKERLKTKQKQQWKEREDRVQQKMQQRQKERRKNIQKRKQEKIDKKIKKAKKRGKLIST